MLAAQGLLDSLSKNEDTELLDSNKDHDLEDLEIVLKAYGNGGTGHKIRYSGGVERVFEFK